MAPPPTCPTGSGGGICQQLAGEHADISLLVSAAGLFVPKPFPECDGASHDFYLELDRAIFFLTQTLARGMAEQGRGGSTVNIGSMRAHQLIAATPSSGCSVAKGGLHALTATLPSSCPSRSGSTRSLRPGSPPRSTTGSSRLTSWRRPCSHHHLPAIPSH